MFRIIISGSRNFNDYELLKSTMNHLLSKIEEQIVVISGRCRGTDTLGERYAQEKGYQIDYFPAEWSKFGRSAGPRRNEQMARNANALVAFWDGVSPGTKNMIALAKRYGLKIRIKKL